MEEKNEKLVQGLLRVLTTFNAYHGQLVPPDAGDAMEILDFAADHAAVCAAIAALGGPAIEPLAPIFREGRLWDRTALKGSAGTAA